MRACLFSIAFLLALAMGCGSPSQILTSPCIDQAATAAGGACPSCSTDADCTILANTCQLSAFCVNKTSNWKASTTTCTAATMFLPNTTSCGCKASICQSK